MPSRDGYRWEHDAVLLPYAQETFFHLHGIMTKGDYVVLKSNVKKYTASLAFGHS